MRRIVYTLTVLTLVWATFTVPMPRIEVAPGAAPPIAPLVEIDDSATTTPINGNLHLLTVSLGSPSLAEVLRALTDDRRSLRSIESVIPPGVDEEVYLEFQRQQFALSFDIAAAVGAAEAGYETSLRTAPRVGGILPDAPAASALEVGDIILEVDGAPVSTATELVEATRTYDEGEAVPLTVLRGDEEIATEVVVGQVAGMPRPGFGIEVGDATVDVELPFAIDLGPTRIGGPSAGMMIALTVYDLLSDEDLARGRIIAGTGTVRFDRTVGLISGVEAKVAAAERVGAQIMLVPKPLADDARGALTTDMRIVGVSTFDEALAALRR